MPYVCMRARESSRKTRTSGEVFETGLKRIDPKKERTRFALRPPIASAERAIGLEDRPIEPQPG